LKELLRKYMREGLLVIKAYLMLARQSFLNNTVYRVNCVIGIVNTMISIFVYVSIWKAIYGGRPTIGDVSFSMVVTSFILGFSINSAFQMNEFIIPQKVRDGTIVTDILKPMSFRGYIFSHNLGDLFFKIIVYFIPAFVLSSIFIGIIPPSSLSMLLFFVLSLVLGYLVIYNLNFIISISSFWFHSVWSLVTLKNVAISIFSGILLPLWFMPKALLFNLLYTYFNIFRTY